MSVDNVYDKKNKNKNSLFTYGLSAILSQLTGFLFLENVKMEKQRTNMPYSQIIPKFTKYNTFVNGFFPYGALQAFSKGFIFGMNQKFLKPHLSFSQDINNIILGLSTGISEAILTSPLLYFRTQLNKKVSEGNTDPFNLKSVFKGSNILIAKRTIDWSTRFIVIDYIKKISPYKNDLVNTFIGSGVSSIFSSPIDRLLPLVYSNQSVMDIFKKQGLSFFYKGFTFRCLSTAHYSTWILLFPDYVMKMKIINDK